MFRARIDSRTDLHASAMKAADIRQKFLEFFRARGHEVRPSGTLVPADDPTLLFTNAGMVPFKKVFLGQEAAPFSRATTSQKCVRAGGKHNDLEEVGRTARHHTFFEMLGNFSFGDYFKRDAVQYAWELLTEVYGLDPARLYATVHHTDDEAAALWADVVGLPPERIFRLGDKDNFWQMADTGPCGPCSELHYDVREVVPERQTTEEFEAAGEREDIIELWNLVFMQFDRDTSGRLNPLPAPSIDTGAGLERLAMVLQGVDTNYHTDLFLPLLARVGQAVGRAYDSESAEAVSYRVLADHARAVAFLLADGVFPSNEGRGYVLRRILRRAVRHAWLLGVREPVLVDVVDAVVDSMSGAYPELGQRRDHLLRTTRSEEERFLATIEGGMVRFDQVAPDGAGDGGGVISGDEAFRLYDTFGFPLDLTELMAEERGYTVDVPGFEASLEEQRRRSRADRASASPAGDEADESAPWERVAEGDQSFVGYTSTEVSTRVLHVRRMDERAQVVLEDNPFYVESGGQVSDGGRVEGEGWAIDIDHVEKVEAGTAVGGPLQGELPDPSEDRWTAGALVPSDVRRDTARNHTATHLLHAALRRVLGEHVVQRGSLVAPQRLRFDFAHPGPMSAEERAEVEVLVNEAVWADHPVRTEVRAYADAVSGGAMALFGEKYGDKVRVVDVPGVSTELCGGTHVRHTGEIGLFRIVGESGVAAGVRRVEAVTGPGAFRLMKEREDWLDDVASALRTQPSAAAQKAQQLLREVADLEALLDEVRRGGGGAETEVARHTFDLGDGATAEYRGVRIKARGADDARAWGDAFLEEGGARAAVLAAEMPEDKRTLFTFVSDGLISRGVRADAVVREVAAMVGGRGGGRPHMAQAGIENPEKVDDALLAGRAVVERLLGGAP